MKKLVTFLLTISFIVSISQTAPEIDWQNTIGGNAFDKLTFIQQTSDEGYILGGVSISNISGDKIEDSLGDYDFWILKTDELGNIVWQNTIGGSQADALYCIQQTTDEGFILGGTSSSSISGDKTENSQGGTDYWIIKVDSFGDIIWQKIIGGSDYDDFIGIQQTIDGGYILGGNSMSNISGDKTENSNGLTDYWVVKLDEMGEISWQNTIGGSSSDILFSIQQTLDGGYILTGSSVSDISGDKTENSNGESDIWIVKLNDLGDIVWQNTIGGNDVDVLYTSQQTSDGGYILGASSMSDISGDKSENAIGELDYWILKLNNSGDIIWQKTIGGSQNDFIWSIYQAVDDGYIIGGSSNSDISGNKTEDAVGGYDYWLVKLDQAGDIKWQKTIGGTNDDYMHSVQQTTNEGFILGGYSKSDISGDKTEDSEGNFDYWLIKLTAEVIDVKEWGILDIKIFPNPVTDFLSVSIDKPIQISITNMLGEIVLLSNQKEIDIRPLIRGVYLLQIFNVNNEKIKTFKLIKN